VLRANRRALDCANELCEQAANTKRNAAEEEAEYARVRTQWEAEVYDGAHVVVLMVDPTKEWTFAYVRDLLKTVPTYMEVRALSMATLLMPQHPSAAYLDRWPRWQRCCSDQQLSSVSQSICD